MSRYIVFERTGEVRTPKEGEHYVPSWSKLPVVAAFDFKCDAHPILRPLPDAEVEAWEALLAGTCDLRDRYAKIEAERDELRATAAKLLAERDELTAEVDDLRGIVEAFKRMVGDADERARFERETAARLLPTIWSRYEGKESGWQQSAVGEACAMARMLADEVFGPAKPEGAANEATT